ncbi:hypothetical protein [Streptomyces sp. NPDC007088]|uniref:hypothetical protein n=1 Tax=Streptomyces sp. NPDC007088 TaxID=3364773 RepID=UPI0036A37C61
MTGSTPPRKHRFRKSAADGGPGQGERVDERGPAASLEGPRAEPRLPAPAGPQDAADGPGAPRTAGGRIASVRGGIRNGVLRGGQGARAALALVADRVIETAPRVPVRDLATLRAQFPGLGPEELADKLVAGAAAAASAVGAGVGAAAMMPVPPAMPAELAAEITAVAAVELKLVAELHEVYGRRPEGALRQRSTAYLTSWTQERGIDLAKPASVNLGLSGHVRKELRQQVMKRMVRNLPNLMPFMIGAAVGAYLNRRDTRRLAEHIRADLRRHAIAWDELPALPPLEQPKSPELLPGPVDPSPEP